MAHPRIKNIVFRGSALNDLRSFPAAARHEAGHQLDLVQQGLNPDNWKPIKTVGSGALEIRISELGQVFRVVYVAKFKASIYVLHCFEKKTQQTSRKDIDLATRRYKDLIKELI
jgi:phage-related protein